MGVEEEEVVRLKVLSATTEPTVTPLSKGTSKGRGGCYHCNDTKHIRANCPLLAKAAVCVVKLDNERNEYDDNLGRSVFKEESLLHDVTLLERPYSLTGIDGSRSKGLSVKHCGSFRDLEELGNSIGYSARASANVLPMAECVDRGYQVEYSNARDEFILHGDMIAYTCVPADFLECSGPSVLHQYLAWCTCSCFLLPR